MNQAEKIKNVLAFTLNQGIEDDEEPSDAITELLESLSPWQLARAMEYLATEFRHEYFRELSGHEQAVGAIFYGAAVKTPFTG